MHRVVEEAVLGNLGGVRRGRRAAAAEKPFTYICERGKECGAIAAERRTRKGRKLWEQLNPSKRRRAVGRS
jgi:hypothetical protein